MSTEYAEIPEAERFPVGARVKVTGEADPFDGRRGGEYVIEGYATADERDDPRPYYAVEDCNSEMFGGVIPHDVLTLIRTPAEEAAQNRMPTVEEIVQHVASEIMGGWGDGIDVNETQRLDSAPDGWPEGDHGFKNGVEFYGRLEGGKTFGCVVRVTALWETN